MEGRTLEDLLAAEGRLSVARALHIAVHVLRGLEQRHALGTVHGHLAPHNIRLVKRLGDPDFAELVDGDGRPGYRAPEQGAGEIDHRADLYGTSAVLFEMLTGSPFDGGETIPRLSDVAASVEVPSDVEMLLRRGLARRPELRPACAGEYAAQLDMLLKAHRRAIAEPTMLLGSAGPSPPLPAPPAPQPPPPALQPPPPALQPTPPAFQPPPPAFQPPPPALQPTPPALQPTPPALQPPPPAPQPPPPALQPPPPALQPPPRVAFLPTPVGVDRRREIVIATMIGVVVLLAAVIGGVLGAQ